MEKQDCILNTLRGFINGYVVLQTYVIKEIKEPLIIKFIHFLIPYFIYSLLYVSIHLWLHRFAIVVLLILRFVIFYLYSVHSTYSSCAEE